MMNDQQKMGGVSALIAAATWVVGMVLLFTLLAPFATGDEDPAFLADNQAIIYIWNLIIYLVFGAFLVVLVLALFERLKAGSPAMVQTATVFGLIWAGLMFASGMVFNIGMETVLDLYGKDPAQAESVWLAVNSVHLGLGGGNEIVGGLWVLLLSWAALRAGGLPRALNYLGVLSGVAGILTLVPALEMIGFIFGLGVLVWFVWVGIVMLRGSSSAAA
jgi:hypothetical protein